MLIIPKKNGEPRRVVDFKTLNSQYQRAVNSSQDTMRMATSVPVPKKGKKMYFSCLDTWNGYHSIPLEKESEKYFRFLTEFGSGDHYVGIYAEIMLTLQKEEQQNPQSPFRCVLTLTKSWGDPSRHEKDASTTR